MTPSEKFCLKWNDFHFNISTSFKDMRQDPDFSDVTLAGEGNQKIEAHKVILASSSRFFKDLLHQNKHPHPLLYMRGIKGKHLSAIIDFMYHGEANIYEEDLNDFLAVAEELELKGLTGPDSKEVQAQQNPPNLANRTEPKEETLNSFVGFDNKFEETTYESKAFQIANISPAINNTSYHELEDQICSMIDTVNGKYSCSTCGNFETSKKQNIRNHIEAKHIEGVSHPCNQCGKSFRSRNSLSKHISVYHKSPGHALPVVFTSQSSTVRSDNPHNL